eukprot:1146864-Pelagomonas_calceolata.AAC.2
MPHAAEACTACSTSWSVPSRKTLVTALGRLHGQAFVINNDCGFGQALWECTSQEINMDAWACVPWEVLKGKQTNMVRVWPLVLCTWGTYLVQAKIGWHSPIAWACRSSIARMAFIHSMASWVSYHSHAAKLIDVLDFVPVFPLRWHQGSFRPLEGAQKRGRLLLPIRDSRTSTQTHTEAPGLAGGAGFMSNNVVHQVKGATALYTVQANFGMAWHGTARHGMVRHGMAWHGMAQHGMA